MSHIIIILVGLVMLLPTLLPLLSVEWWWVRVWDFLRAQLVGLYLVVTVLMLLVAGRGWASLALYGLLALALLFQLTWIVPYLPLVPLQTQYASIADEAFTLRILIANVLMTNRAAARFISMVERVEPDLVIITATGAAAG
jgi:endonuclease/exonuclease/phosphatase (EEP) superfamily protein YafD